MGTPQYFARPVRSMSSVTGIQRQYYGLPPFCPSDPSFFNSVNLMLDDDTGLLMLCDVGLSPHEDSLHRHGLAFYDGENVKRYIGHMQEFEELLLSIA